MTGAVQKGVQGEEQALAYLIARGYRLVERNFRIKGGEIDLILEKDGCLIFAEVKRRLKANPGAGLEAVTAKKQRRILTAAGQYLSRVEGFSRPLRFDVVEITAGGILHIENAFSGEWPG